MTPRQTTKAKPSEVSDKPEKSKKPVYEAYGGCAGNGFAMPPSLISPDK